MHLNPNPSFHEADERERTPLKRTSDREAAAISVMERMGSASMRDISIGTEEPQHCIRYTLRVMHAERRVHISGWESAPGKLRDTMVPRYSAGPGKDVPAPPGSPLHKRQDVSALDFNPGADLQLVTVLWGQSSMQEHQYDEEQ